MARQELLCVRKIGICGPTLAILRIQEDFCGRRKQNVMADWRTLRRYGAPEEGPEERIQCRHPRHLCSFILLLDQLVRSRAQLLLGILAAEALQVGGGSSFGGMASPLKVIDKFRSRSAACDDLRASSLSHSIEGVWCRAFWRAIAFGNQLRDVGKRESV